MNIEDIKLEVKQSFRLFFEGINTGGHNTLDPIIDIPIIYFGITDIIFSEDDNNIEVLFVLSRPGLLIGIAGSTLRKLEKYMNSRIKSEKHIKILIKECELWK